MTSAYNFATPAMRGARYHYKLWRLAGLWLLPTDPPLWHLLAYCTHFVCFVLFNGLLLLSLVAARSLDDIIETLLPSTTTVVISIQAVLLMCNRRRLQHLFHLTKLLERSTRENPAEVGHLERSNRSYHWLLVGMSLGCYFSILWRFGTTVVAAQRRLMWRSWFPFDWETAETSTLYWSAMAFQITCNAYIGVLFTTVDTLGPMVYGTLGAFLDVLADRLRAAGSRLEVSGRSDRRALVECVRYHNLCLRYQRCLDELLDVHYMVQFIASGLVLCLTAFMLSIGRPADDWSKFAFLMLYIGNMGGELFIPCYYGSVVRAKSEQLTVAAFQSGWPEEAALVADGGRVGFARALLLFMQGASRPIVQYTWKKVFVIALPSFVTVCRAAYSLLSCLKGQ